MSNDQLTINTLRELNSRLASEITELRKENAEISELRKKFSKVEAENIELKAEKVKLKQALKEHESKFVKLEQNDKDTAVENAELKARVAKLEQKQSQNDEERSNHIVKLDDDTKEIEQVSTLIPKKKKSSTSINASCRMNSDDAPEQIISQRDKYPDI
ncbi:zinc finger bed domain-containing protein 1-like [Gigaspora margarita]|uniref:Zinc finger bed domain-containing protein 1-like n=1 Tax=Gigaspora margarita TaxID=4874 RepID=A0A8H4B589_GIGMA|nr:zinc finger bed domain-containing protein 1-like [Gigaspora margarita]